MVAKSSHPGIGNHVLRPFNSEFMAALKDVLFIDREDAVVADRRRVFFFKRNE